MAFAPLSVVTNVIAKFERPVTHTPRTKIEDARGDETLTDGSPVVINVGILQRSNSWISAPQGEQFTGDAYCVARSTITINKNDKINVDNQDYIVKTDVVRYAGSDNATKAYTYCVLKKL